MIKDVREGMSGMSADVPRFGLRIHSVSSAICSYKNIGVKFDEIVNFFADLLVDFRLKCLIFSQVITKSLKNNKRTQ